MSEGYYDLGTYSRPVTTGSEEAQRWFDRGLVWTYGYNHDEAVACYRRALDADPACAMAWWGGRLRGRAKLQQAVGGVSTRGDAVRSLETALRRVGTGAGARPERDGYTSGPSSTPSNIATHHARLWRDMCPWNDAYAGAMRGGLRWSTARMTRTWQPCSSRRS